VAWTAFIGEDVRLDYGDVVQSYARLERNVHLGQRVLVGRYALLSNIEVGEGSHIEYGVVVTGHGDGKITIGRECYIGIHNVLDWSDNITIGNFVHIAGPSTGLWTHSSVHQALSGHTLENKIRRERKPILIGDCVYIGGNCTIYPGVSIGDHSVVAPNSAVTADVPSHMMVGGVPAKVIKTVNL
jgi:acetyltransferase-like isoleucine patch superfamily enzyme